MRGSRVKQLRKEFKRAFNRLPTASEERKVKKEWLRLRRQPGL